jgi:hypothetical protein
MVALLAYNEVMATDNLDLDASSRQDCLRLPPGEHSATLVRAALTLADALMGPLTGPEKRKAVELILSVLERVDG